MPSNGFRIAVAAFELESWPVVIVRTPAVVCAPRDPFTPRRSNIRTSINNNTSAWPRDWPRDPIAYRTPTSSVDPNTRGQFRSGPAGTTTAAAPTAGGVQTIRATQSAVVAQPTTPPPSKPPEKPQY